MGLPRNAALERTFERNEYATPSESGDWLFQELVQIVNRSPDTHFSLPMTVVMGGQVMTGRLISHIFYLIQMREMLVPQKLQTEEYQTMWAARLHVATEKKQSLRPKYFHLAEARVLVETRETIPGTGLEPLLWRGRVDAVTGFSMRQLVLQSATPHSATRSPG